MAAVLNTKQVLTIVGLAATAAKGREEPLLEYLSSMLVDNEEALKCRAYYEERVSLPDPAEQAQRSAELEAAVKRAEEAK